MSEIPERYARLADDVTATASYEGQFGPSTVEKAVDGFGTLDLLVHGADEQTRPLHFFGRRTG